MLPMTTWKRDGYKVRLHKTDHPPVHVHVYKDGCEVAKFDLESQSFMSGDARHFGRVRKVLKDLGLI